MKDYYLKTSDIFVSKEDYKITTVLGSCVAVCLWDKKLKYGGMIHFLLPQWDKKREQSVKYGDLAINMLIDKMLELGSQNKNLQAEIFGGARMLNQNLNIGNKNVEIAFGILKHQNIPVVNSDTGGIIARKIIFYNLENKIKLIKLPKIL